MKRRDFLKFFGIGLAASLATRAANARVCERQNGFLDRVYPVGSIYISIDSNNPGARLGGTWVRFGNGRALVGVDEENSNFNTVQRTGGAETHTLTIAQIPSHNHTIFNMGAWGSQHTGNTIGQGSNGNSRNNETSFTGEGGAHNNLQPYVTVFMWRRSA